MHYTVFFALDEAYQLPCIADASQDSVHGFCELITLPLKAGWQIDRAPLVKARVPLW